MELNVGLDVDDDSDGELGPQLNVQHAPTTTVSRLATWRTRFWRILPWVSGWGLGNYVNPEAGLPAGDEPKDPTTTHPGNQPKKFVPSAGIF